MLAHSFLGNIFPLLGSMGTGLRIFVGLLSFTLYLLSANGYYHLAKGQHIEYAFIAFLPFIRFYMVGEIIGEKMTFIQWTLPYVQVVYPLFALASLFVSPLPFIGTLFFICLVVYAYTALYRVLCMYVGKEAVPFLIVCIFFPFMFYIYPFIIRHRPLISR